MRVSGCGLAAALRVCSSTLRARGRKARIASPVSTSCGPSTANGSGCVPRTIASTSAFVILSSTDYADYADSKPPRHRDPEQSDIDASHATKTEVERVKIAGSLDSVFGRVAWAGRSAAARVGHSVP